MKSFVGLGSVLLLLSVATGACFEETVPVGADDGGVTGDAASGVACTADSDCPANEGCAYEESLACHATGQCVAEAQAVCEAYSPGCACDGTEINIGCSPYPAGFSSKPLNHVGACTSADAGVGGACTADSDCPAGDGCAYDAKDACAAKGVCVTEALATCAAFSPGCACDGTEINIACTPYPDGYESKPLAHDGTCEDDGGAGGSDGGTGGEDAGTGGACASDADCGANQGCAYAEADACSATGQCVAESGAICNTFEAGCACDGTVINIACTPYPEGFVAKPLAHAGECGADAGVGAADGGSGGADASTGADAEADVGL